MKSHKPKNKERKMRKKGILTAISFLLVLCFVLSPIVASAQKSKPDVIRWKGQFTFSPSKTGFGPFKVGEAGVGAHTLMWTEWLKKASGGRLIIEWAEPGSIFPPSETDLAVGKNVVQIATSYASYYRGRIPETDVETGGVFLWENEEQVFECLHKYGLYPALQKVYAKHNLKWLPYHSNAIVGMFTNFPAPSPEAIKGKKIRAVGMWADYIKLLGGSPVSLSWGEQYMAMKLGTIDGIVAGAAIFEELKIKEVAKGYVYSPVISKAVANLVINMDAFNALPKDLQALLQRDTPYITYALSSNWYNQCTWALKNAEEEYGVQMYSWSPKDISNITKRVYDEIYPKISERSKDSAELMEIVKKQMRDYGRIK
jgi:TRAP-type C4-dicarboxylate transport system substrate-binding protein